jgi:hypothetical protein
LNPAPFDGLTVTSLLVALFHYRQILADYKNAINNEF